MALSIHSTPILHDGIGLGALIRSALSRRADDRRRDRAYRKTC